MIYNSFVIKDNDLNIEEKEPYHDYGSFFNRTPPDNSINIGGRDRDGAIYVHTVLEARYKEGSYVLKKSLNSIEMLAWKFKEECFKKNEEVEFFYNPSSNILIKKLNKFEYLSNVFCLKRY